MAHAAGRLLALRRSPAARASGSVHYINRGIGAPPGAIFMLKAAPKLAIIFINTGMRELQMNFTNTMCQALAQHCVRVCTHAVMTQLTSLISVALVLTGTIARITGRRGEAEYDVSSRPSGICQTSMRYAAMLSVRLASMAFHHMDIWELFVNNLKM